MSMEQVLKEDNLISRNAYRGFTRHSDTSFKKRWERKHELFAAHVCKINLHPSEKS